MRCDQAVRLLALYIDSELDSRTSFEICRHLESCPSCRDKFESERAIEEETASLFKQPDPAWREAWRAAASRPRPRRRSRVLLVAAAGVLVCAAAVGVAVASIRREPELARLSWESHKKSLLGELRPTVTADLEESRRYLRSQGILLPELAKPEEGSWVPVGARSCRLGPVPVAYLMGRIEATEVSVFVFPSERLEEFPDSSRLIRGGETFHCTVGGVPFVAAVRAGYCVCAVGEVPPDRLGELAEGLVEVKR